MGSRTDLIATEISFWQRVVYINFHSYTSPNLSNPYNGGSVPTMGIARGQNDAIAPQVFGAVQGDVRTCDNLCKAGSVLRGGRDADTYRCADWTSLNEIRFLLKSAANTSGSQSDIRAAPRQRYTPLTPGGENRLAE